MQSSLEKLRKFFRLEHENGYSNTAIIGGLAKMLDFWAAEARADGINEEVIQAVEQRLRSYDGLSPLSRADALKGLWKRIGDTYPETQQRPQQRPQQSQAKPRRTAPTHGSTQTAQRTSSDRNASSSNNPSRVLLRRRVWNQFPVQSTAKLPPRSTRL